MKYLHTVNRSEAFPPRPDYTALFTNKQSKASLQKSLLLSFQTERCSSVFLGILIFRLFFKKCSFKRGRCCRVGRPVAQSRQSIPLDEASSHGIGRYKDKMAARSMRAELSSRMENRCRPAEFTSLLAGSGDSWLIPSERKKKRHLVKTGPAFFLLV